MAEVFRIIFPAKDAEGRLLNIRMPDHGFRPIPESGERVQWPGPANHWARAEQRGDIRSEEDKAEPVEGEVLGPQGLQAGELSPATGSSTAGDSGEGPHPSPIPVRGAQDPRKLPESEDQAREAKEPSRRGR